MIAVRLIRTLSVFAACTLALSSIAVTAVAAEGSESGDEIGLYVEYSGGLSIVRDQNVHSRAYAGVNGKFELAPGWNAAIAMGMRFQKYFRGEAQISYHNTQVQRMPVPTAIPAPPPAGTGATTAQGDLGLFAAMANGYVDLDFDIPFVPYVGAGIGYGVIEFQAKNQATALKINDHTSVFVWNVMAGATVPVSESIDLSLGYRYLATNDYNIESRVRNLGKATLDTEYDNHEAVLGLRFNF